MPKTFGRFRCQKGLVSCTVDVLLWRAMRLAGISLTLSEVRKRSYSPEVVPTYAVCKDQAKTLFDIAEAASNHTDDKIKQLLAVSSSLATFVAVFGHDAQPRIVGILVVVVLVLVVLLCLSAFEVRQSMTPTLEDVGSEDNSKIWAKDLLTACHANRAGHSFRVDQYRTASRYFILALICTLWLAASQKSKDSLADITAIMKRMEHDGLTTHSATSLSAADTLMVRVIPGAAPKVVPNHLKGVRTSKPSKED